MGKFLLLCFCIFLVASFLGLCGGQLSEEDGDSSTPTVEMEMMAPMESSEREALYSAIQGFVGKDWNGSDLYPDPCGLTPIQGVSCELYNGSWYVSTMNIGPVYDNSLQCTRNAKFTHHLFDLQHLTTLSFYSCFSSSSHSQIRISNLRWEKLSRTLQSLEFRSNPGLVGPIPASLGTLTQLQSLILLENGLTGELPAEIGRSTKLRRLVLSGNRFEGHLPSSLGGLTQLLILDCSRNNLSGSIPLTFGGLTSLLKLDLSKNNLEGSLPMELTNLKNLTLMDLGSNNLSGGLSKSVQEMVSLTEMVMSNNPILGGDLMRIQWKNLLNLQVLDLTNAGLKGEIPESISELKRLRFLGLGQNSLSGTPPVKLSSMPDLTALYLNGNNLSGELGFPDTFVAKMRRRFGAWDNINLCSKPGSYIPFGVRTCPEENLSVHTSSSVNLNKENPHWKLDPEASSGCEQWGINEFSWSSIVSIIVVVVLNLILSPL